MKLSKLKTIIEVILIFSITILIGMIVYDYFDMKKTENYTEGMINEIDKIIENNKENNNDTLLIVNDNNDNLQDTDSTSNTKTTVIQTQAKTVKISGFNVFGKIKIDKIGIEYPIIEYLNSDALWKSICKISDNDIDGTGNLCLAGHNMRNLTMFGNLRKLGSGDSIEIIDLKGKTYLYEVYDKFYINPDQVDIINKTDDPIVTLITCNDSSDKRLIVRGRLISES